jgi:thiamine pyrophosphate-dependent acetolactate synthase large subunit-like protein
VETAVARDPDYLFGRSDQTAGDANRRLSQAVIEDNVTLCLDVGSSYIWLARYLKVFRPRQMIIGNGQQTLGVALPWAIQQTGLAYHVITRHLAARTG